VRPDKFYQDAFKSVGYVNDETVFIASDIKNDPVITNEIDGRSEVIFYVMRRRPVSTLNESEPSFKRRLRMLVTFPKYTQCSLGNYLHLNQVTDFLV
jgi:hypothetical protein